MLLAGREVYEYKVLEKSGEFIATTDSDGKLWVLIGTDSGYEGKTSLYYTNIAINMREFFD